MNTDVTLLYAEDDPAIARLVQRRLSREGYRVLLAGSAEEAVKQLIGTPFDLIISDYRLPGADGLSLLGAVRGHCPDTPVIIMSGWADLRLVIEAMKQGAAEFVIKDVEGAFLDLLPTLIERVLNSQRILRQQARLEAALEEEQALSRLALQCISQGLAVFDKDLNLRLCNRNFLDFCGFPESLGKRGTSTESMLRFNAERGGYGTENIEEAVQSRLERARAFKPFRFERPMREKGVMEVTSQPMPGGGSVITYTDITERWEAEQKIRQQAHYDALTGLVNRTLFNELIRRQILKSARERSAFALMFIDLDGFKGVNDGHGHEAGDALLKEVAIRLRNAVRESDVVARLGGDEFTLTLLDMQPGEAVKSLAQGVIDKLSEPYWLDQGISVDTVSASIGIALYPSDGDNAPELLRRSDKAMYAAKAAGKRQFAMASLTT